MDGSEGAQAKKGARLRQPIYLERTDMPVLFQDERLSTVEAKRVIRDARKTEPGTRYDAAAAALILQAYLDSILVIQFIVPSPSPTLNTNN